NYRYRIVVRRNSNADIGRLGATRKGRECKSTDASVHSSPPPAPHRFLTGGQQALVRRPRFPIFNATPKAILAFPSGKTLTMILFWSYSFLMHSQRHVRMPYRVQRVANI